MSVSATLLVTGGLGVAECELAVGHFLNWMADRAALCHLDLDIAERPARVGPSSAVVIVGGKGAEAFARQVEGVVLWRCQSPLRPQHDRKSWFIQCFRLPATPAALQIAPGEIEMQAIRAGGPGGQHQNKTSSAIRARWRDPQGKLWSVVVRDSRSQHQNRKLALDRLASLIAAEQAETEASRKYRNWVQYNHVQRGSPRWTFSGPGFEQVTPG